MRTLILTRAIPGTGKSTWLDKNNLSPFVLSPDSYRMEAGGLVMNSEGNMVIDQGKSGYAWKRTFELLENKMKNGEFAIIDATHLVNKNLSEYKKLSEKYRYRVFMLDMTKEVTLEELYRRDELRPDYKKVGSEVLKHMHANMLKQNDEGIPKWIEVVTPDNFSDVVLKNKYVDLSEYNKVVLIGDIHGSYTALMEYLGGRLKDDVMYIFTGDFFERGIENVQVLNWLLKVYTKKNVILIEGNHELYAFQYANDDNIHCKEFSNVVAKEFDEAKVDKKEIRRLYRKLRVTCLFEYRGKRFVVTHGGITTVPDSITLMTNTQLIRGVGDYSLDVDELFTLNVLNYEGRINDGYEYYQVHGHRNQLHKDVINGRSVNLEGNIEGGGHLRVLEVTGEGLNTVEVENKVFNEKYKRKELTPNSTVKEMVEILRENTFVRESDNGNGISAFNFTTQAFYDSVWNNQTVKARGLHVDVINMVIIGRSYEKFFNLEEYDGIEDLLD